MIIDEQQDRSVRFFSLHEHGFVRVAVSTPKAHVGDPQRNGESIVTEARRATERGVDLIVFPELSVSAYAIDDLHLQDALLDDVEQAIRAILRASSTLR